MITELSKKTHGFVLAVIMGIAVFVSLLVDRNVISQGAVVLIATYLITGDRPGFVYAIVKCLPRDSSAIYRFIALNWRLIIWERQNQTVASIFQEVVRVRPDKVAVMMGDVKMTFQQAENFSNQIAAYFKSQNFKRGDTIALLMDNCPEYAFIWIGLSKLGIITALVNTNLRKTPLAHSIKVSNAKAVIVASDLADAVHEIRSEDDIKDLKMYRFHDDTSGDQSVTGLPDAVNLFAELKTQPINPPIAEMKLNSSKDKLLYIYTSGTTGLPKAAVITNLRYMFMVLGCNKMTQMQPDDILYNPLPLYHTAGGIIGIGNVILFGIALAMRKRFSASNYWTDCIKHKCTMSQYIGEMCRFLLSLPAKPQDNQHSIRLMFGNGMRPQIWQQFVNRFKVPNICEIYGSTEGNANLINIDNTVGAVGFVPLFAKLAYPLALIRCDEHSGEPIRNEKGLCIACKPGEIGILVGKINQKQALIAFEGYADKKASEKKILHDVLKKGDAYFNSGDILVMDLFGYFYFKDRTGDTFRWRGENVSTAEVEAVISNVAELNDATVYGVSVPHVEGKAGMAAIVDIDNTINMESIGAGIRGSLPPYARPIFIRLLKELPMTGTFKLKKRDLQLEGFDIHKTKDIIYFLHGDGVYRPLTEKDYDDVMSGRARL